MATPLYDALSVQHSKNVGDPVAAAATDGKRFTSAQRDYHLNTAIRRFLVKHLAALKSKAEKGVNNNVNYDALSGYIVSDGWTQTANSVLMSLYGLGNTPATSGILEILSAYDTTTTTPVIPLPPELKYQASAGGNQFLLGSVTRPYYFIEGASIKTLGCAATDTLTLKFVRQHTDHVSGGSAVTVVSDTAFTATGTAITNFTGVISTHVGGQLVGIDSGANVFVRTITAYVSATACTINSALVADGACTNGYIIPNLAGEITIPTSFHNQVLDLAFIVETEESPSNEVAAVIAVKEARLDKDINGQV